MKALIITITVLLGMFGMSIKNDSLGAVRVSDTQSGGTGTSSPSGIQYGDTSASFKTVVIGSGLAFSSGTLSSTGGAGTPGGSNTQIQYNNSGAFAGDANLTWTSASRTLTLGAENVTNIILSPDATVSGNNGGRISVASGYGNGSGSGGDLSFISGDGGSTGNGGNINFNPGAGHGGGTSGVLQIQDPDSGYLTLLKTSSITSDRTFTFPNSTGTFCLTVTCLTTSLTKGYFIVGNDAGVAQATSSIFISSLGNLGLGSTTPFAKLSILTNSATLWPQAISTTTGNTVLGVDNLGHIRTGGYTPAVSTCGTTPSIVGNDIAGSVTVGSGVSVLSCTITFSAPFTNTPKVFVSPNSALSVGVSAKSASAFTVTFSVSLASGQFDYFITD